MQLNNITKEKGFTLIEMLVSIALFSVVITVTLGSIMTIADSNKKARSLMTVTNNLNFAVDSMVRSFKTGDATPGFANGDCFQTDEIDYVGGDTEFDTRSVEYCFEEVDGFGRITKQVQGGAAVPLTSSDVDIDELSFEDISSGTQPILSIIMSGTVQVSPRISSSFSIQTAVSQRKLQI